MRRFMGALCLSIAPQPMIANEINFEQSLGTTDGLSIEQSGSRDHEIYGLNPSNLPDKTLPMKLYGNFGTVDIVQDGAGATDIAASISATVAGDLAIRLGGDGNHMVSLYASAGTIDTDLTVNSVSASNIQLTVDAAGTITSQNLTLSGYGINLGVEQTAASNLTASLYANGNGAAANIVQLGSNSSLYLDAILASNSTLNVTQSGNSSIYTLTAELGQNSTLNVSQSASSTTASDLGVVVPEDMTVTISR